MMRRVLALVLVLLIYTVIGGLLAEGVLRIARLAPPADAPGYFWQTNHPVTGWTLQPDAEGRWFNPMYEYDQHIEINSQGLRSAEVCLETEDPACPPDEEVLRVLVLGDSYVEALHVPLEATFGQQLARQLTATRVAEHRSVEVVNVGVSGWGTDQQLLWLREQGARYAPDIILLAFYPGNDFMNNHMPLEYANFGGVRKPWFSLEADALELHEFPFDSEAARASRDRFEARLSEVLPSATTETATSPTETTSSPSAEWLQPLGAWLKQNSALYRYVEPRIRIAAPNFAASLARTGLITPGQETSDQAMGAEYLPVTYGVYATEPAPVWEEAFAVTGALFAELQTEAAALDAELAAVVLTAPEQVDAARWEQELARYPALASMEWSLDESTRRAVELLAAAEIPTLNLLPLFREAAANEAQLHFEDDGHWTETGHRFAGALAANFLMVQGLVAPAPGSTATVEIPSGTPHLLWWALIIVVAILVVSVAWSAWKSGPVAWARGAWAGLGTTAELFVFTLRRGQFVVLPLLIVLILFGGLLLIAQSSVVGPFIYPLF